MDPGETGDAARCDRPPARPFRATQQRLGLHRLRLHGELTELRADDLRFSLAEARDLFAGSGVDLPETALAVLHERTEGWAAYQAGATFFDSFPRASEWGERAMELAHRHGWADEPSSGIVAMVIGAVRAWQGRVEEAEPWIRRSERILRAESHPVAGMATYYVRGVLELARGRDAEALAAFRAAERPAGQLAGPNLLVTALRAFILQTPVRG